MWWPVPASWLVASLAMILLAGGIVAHRSRRRRIGRFGDSVILGVSRRRFLWTMTLLLQIAAAVCIATAVVMKPPAGQDFTESPDSLGIVIDLQSMNVKPLFDAARAVMEESPPCRVAIYLAGSPPELLVPPTTDMQGALMAMNEQLARDAPLRRVKGTGAHAAHIVNITGRATEEIENAHVEFRGGSPVAFVTLSAGNGGLLFGTVNPEGGLIWSSSPLELHAFLASRRIEEPHRFSPVQWLVLLGFVFMSVECLWELVRP